VSHPHLFQVKGADRLIAKLKQLQVKAKQSTKDRIVVGYEAYYAVYVHESVEMKLQGVPRPSGIGRYWDPQGQAEAKFLERAVRSLTYSGELSRIVVKVAKSTKSVSRALLSAGVAIRNEAQRRTPVETGYLKNSAYARVE
jgi:hypothetical protein